jgi:hypothetical protein
MNIHYTPEPKVIARTACFSFSTAACFIMNAILVPVQE